MDNRPRREAPEAVDTQGYCQAEIEVTHGFGLHARPSVVFTRLAKSFPCTVEIEVNDSNVWLNGKSIVKIMGARISEGFDPENPSPRLTRRGSDPCAQGARRARFR